MSAIDIGKLVVIYIFRQRGSAQTDVRRVGDERKRPGGWMSEIMCKRRRFISLWRLRLLLLIKERRSMVSVLRTWI